MEKQLIKTFSVEETEKIAAQLALLLKPGVVITLEGELGSGKTSFTKGLANGLGVKQTVNSPTYTIVKEYQGEIPLYHMDVYRLENSEEDIGFDEYFHGEGVSVVEWAHFIEEFLPKERLNITIKHVDDHTRLIEFLPKGQYYESVVTELLRK